MDFDAATRAKQERHAQRSSSESDLQVTLNARHVASKRVQDILRDCASYLEQNATPDFVVSAEPGKNGRFTQKGVPVPLAWSHHGRVLVSPGHLYSSSYSCKFSDIPRGDYNKQYYDAAAKHSVAPDKLVVGVDRNKPPMATDPERFTALPSPEGVDPTAHYSSILTIPNQVPGSQLGTFRDGTPALIHEDSDGYDRVQTFEGFMQSFVVGVVSR